MRHSAVLVLTLLTPVTPVTGAAPDGCEHLLTPITINHEDVSTDVWDHGSTQH